MHKGQFVYTVKSIKNRYWVSIREVTNINGDNVTLRFAGDEEGKNDTTLSISDGRVSRDYNYMCRVCDKLNKELKVAANE